MGTCTCTVERLLPGQQLRTLSCLPAALFANWVACRARIEKGRVRDTTEGSIFCEIPNSTTHSTKKIDYRNLHAALCMCVCRLTSQLEKSRYHFADDYSATLQRGASATMCVRTHCSALHGLRVGRQCLPTCKLCASRVQQMRQARELHTSMGHMRVANYEPSCESRDL